MENESNNNNVCFHEMQSAISALSNENMNLKMEIAGLTSRLQESANGNLSLVESEAARFNATSQLEKSQEQIVMLEKKYKKAMTNVMKLDSAWKSTNTALCATKTELSGVVENYTALQSKFEEAQGRIAELNRACEAMQNKNMTLQSALDEANRTKTELNSSILSLNAQLSVARSTKDDVESNADACFNELKSKYNEELQKNATLAGKVRGLESSLESVTKSLTQTRTDLSATQANNLSLLSQVSDLNTHVKTNSSLESSLKAEKVVLSNEVSRLQSVIEDLSESNTNLEHTISRHQIQDESHNQNLQKLVAHNEKAVALSDKRHEEAISFIKLNHEKQICELQSTIQSLSAELSSITMKIESTSALLNNSTSTTKNVETLQTWVSALVEEFSVARKKIESLKKSVASKSEVASQLKKATEENVKLVEEVEKLKAMVHRMTHRKLGPYNKDKENVKTTTNNVSKKKKIGTLPPPNAALRNVKSRYASSSSIHKIDIR